MNLLSFSAVVFCPLFYHLLFRLRSYSLHGARLPVANRPRNRRIEPKRAAFCLVTCSFSRSKQRGKRRAASISPSASNSWSGFAPAAKRAAASPPTRNGPLRRLLAGPLRKDRSNIGAASVKSTFCIETPSSSQVSLACNDSVIWPGRVYRKRQKAAFFRSCWRTCCCPWRGTPFLSGYQSLAFLHVAFLDIPAVYFCVRLWLSSSSSSF